MSYIDLADRARLVVAHWDYLDSVDPSNANVQQAKAEMDRLVDLLRLSVEQETEGQSATLRYHLGARQWEVDAAAAREIHLSLENCYALARRMARKDTDSEWQHMIRFCEAAGLKQQILRGESHTSLPVEDTHA